MRKRTSIWTGRACNSDSITAWSLHTDTLLKAFPLESWTMCTRWSARRSTKSSSRTKEKKDRANLTWIERKFSEKFMKIGLDTSDCSFYLTRDLVLEAWQSLKFGRLITAPASTTTATPLDWSRSSAAPLGSKITQNSPSLHLTANLIWKAITNKTNTLGWASCLSESIVLST